MKLIVYLIVEVVGWFILGLFFTFPGAFLRSITFQKDRRLRNILKEDKLKNFGLTLSIYLLVTYILVFLF